MNNIICAISTSPGESAIGIVRMTGEGCIALANSLFQAAHRKKLCDFPARHMTYGHIVSQGEALDEVLAVYYLAPHSYTAEDMVEVFAHGNYLALQSIMQLFIKNGAAPAEAGDFTKRAFLNGRIDLSQAEAVMDVISAKTKRGFTVAQQQLSGSLSHHLVEIDQAMTDLLAQIEVTIDYPDEEVEIITKARVLESMIQIKQQLTELINSYQYGKILKEGLRIVIVGRPNVGKSSLLNALLGKNRAIVTEHAGTTRDVIEEVANIRGIAIRLIDTAGIRETDNMIEKIGIEKTKQYFNQADIALLVLDAAEPLSKEDREIFSVIDQEKCIVLVNKTDLERKIDLREVEQKLPNAPIIEIVALRAEGIRALEDKIESLVLSGQASAKSGEMISNARQYDVINRALAHVERALSALRQDIPLDLIEVDLIEAYDILGEISGKTAHIDVIDRIFAKFCLGK